MNINPATVDALSAAEGIAATIAADAVAAPQANLVAAPSANTAATADVTPAAAAPQAANPAGAGVTPAFVAPQAANPAGASGVTPAVVAPQAANPAGAGAGLAPQANAPALPSFNDAAIMFDDGVATAAAAVAIPAQGNTTCILSYDIEGIRNLEPHVQRHATAFYNIIVPLFEAAGDTYKIMDRVKYYRIMGALQRARDGELMSSLRHKFRQIHNWNKVFAVVVAGGSSILVSRPKEMIGVDNIDAELVRRVSYLERVFSDLLVGHGLDHSKGRTLYARVADNVSNIPREVCKHFTDTCPRCIERQKRTRPTAGLRPIVTSGFNTRGQVDLIDFQSMPDGDFRFLLNYIDHGIKFLFSIPITRKKGSCIAMALFHIFTIIGPPMILQSDNGSEFHGAAMTARYGLAVVFSFNES